MINNSATYNKSSRLKKIRLRKASSLKAMSLAVSAIALIMGLFFNATAASGATTVYEFDTCARGTACWAYFCDVDIFPFAGIAGNRNSQVIATNAQYNNIATSNNGRWTTTDPGAGDQVFMWFEMNIAEDISRIDQIDFLFEGYTNGGATNHSIHVLKTGLAWQTSANWTQQGAVQNIATGADTTFTRSMTTDFADYVSATTGLITWGVYESRVSESMQIDFVSMTVTFNAPPVLNIDSASQTSVNGSGEVTLQYDLTDAELAACSLLIEYSYDNTNWYQAYIKSASHGTVNNAGVGAGTSTGQITAIATNRNNATFIWDTKNASNENGAFTGEDTTVWLRVTPIDPRGNGTMVSSGAFTVDNQGPTVTINDPAAGEWRGSNFTVDVTNADSGLGLGTCYYRVLSNAVQTLAWTAYVCGNDPVITVGAAANCRNQGSNMCQTEFYGVDVAGNTGTTVTRQFSIDWTQPTTVINSPAAGSWQIADFAVDVTNADTGGSGLATCYYRVVSNAVETLAWTSYVCGNDPTVTVGGAADCRDEGTNICQVEFYNEDTAGNTGTTQTRQFSIDWQDPTTTINSPAAGACLNSNFIADVTNSDGSGSGLNVCYYRM
nr:hypothetical protein [bacterium]